MTSIRGRVMCFTPRSTSLIQLRSKPKSLAISAWLMSRSCRRVLMRSPNFIAMSLTGSGLRTDARLAGVLETRVERFRLRGFFFVRGDMGVILFQAGYRAIVNGPQYLARLAYRAGKITSLPRLPCPEWARGTSISCGLSTTPSSSGNLAPKSTKIRITFLVTLTYLSIGLGLGRQGRSLDDVGQLPMQVLL